MVELPENIDLNNKEFLQAWRLIRNTNNSVFLTGKAGTGKSTFLRYICEHTNKNYVIVAPTGVAAMNVGGVTLHSFFKIPMRPIPPDDVDYSLGRIRSKLKFSKEKIKIIKSLELLIIDEISMVRADIIDFIDRALRAYSDNKREPFGGKQLLLVGDIFQLEPVITPDTRNILSYYYSNFFFFNAKAYADFNLISIELKKIYRQKDAKFVSILDRIRINKATKEDLEVINKRYVVERRQENNDFTITLASKRDIVDSINSRELELLPGKEIIYKGRVEGDFPDKILPTDKDLVLKKDAQVILIKNDKDHRWVNGTIAKVHKLTKESLMIELESGEIHSIEPEIWDNVKYTYDEGSKKIKEDILGQFIQFPIKAAWALTVHKSQGLTFSRVRIDLGDRAFSSGQTYVALSRCTSLDGITMCAPITSRDIITNPEIVKFSNAFNNQLMIDTAFENAKANMLYGEAIEAFNKREIRQSVEKTIEALSISNKITSPEIIRFISSKLNIINKQQSEIEHMKMRFKSLAGEYIDMGGECLHDKTMWKAALSNFDKALSLDADNENAIYGRALALCDGEKYKLAKEAIDKLLKINKKHYNAYCLLGSVYMEMSQPDDALLSFASALKLNKKDASLHDNIASVLEELDLIEEAAKHRATAIKLRNKKSKK